jgi:hypothetical protein
MWHCSCGQPRPGEALQCQSMPRISLNETELCGCAVEDGQRAVFSGRGLTCDVFVIADGQRARCEETQRGEGGRVAQRHQQDWARLPRQAGALPTTPASFGHVVYSLHVCITCLCTPFARPVQPLPRLAKKCTIAIITSINITITFVIFFSIFSLQQGTISIKNLVERRGWRWAAVTSCCMCAHVRG